MTSKHTPTPWVAMRNIDAREDIFIEGGDYAIAEMLSGYTDAESEANAERIVHCVNNFDVLLDALKEIAAANDTIAINEEIEEALARAVTIDNIVQKAIERVEQEES